MDYQKMTRETGFGGDDRPSRLRGQKGHKRSLTDPPGEDEDKRRSNALGGLIANELKQSGSVSDAEERGRSKHSSFLPGIDENNKFAVGVARKRTLLQPSGAAPHKRSISNPPASENMDILPQFNVPRMPELPGRKLSLVATNGAALVRYLPALSTSASRNPSMDWGKSGKGFDGDGAIQVQSLLRSAQPVLPPKATGDIRQSFSLPESFGKPGDLQPLHINALMEYRLAMQTEADEATDELKKDGFGDGAQIQEKMSKFLTPQEIRERMLDYDGGMPKVPLGQRRRSSTNTEGPKPAWRPGGAAAINFAQVMKNRTAAKELAERTRRALLADDEDEEDEIDFGKYDGKDYIFFSTDSVAEDTVGPFPHEHEDLRDSNGNILPTANKFAHHVLKVLNKYEDQPVGQVTLKPLQPRPAAAPKPKISYPAIRRKKDEPEVEQSVPVEIPAELPEPKAVEHPPQEFVPRAKPPPEKQKHIREILELIVEKMEDEILPRGEDEKTLRELRVSFVNDFAIMDNRATTIRENEMAMLLRDIDMLPTVPVEAMSPEIVCEMCWNLFRYLRAMLPDSMIPMGVAASLVEVMEQDDEDEHRMYEMKRIVARLVHDDYIIIKALFGHLTRLGTAFYHEGVHLHKGIAFLFANLLFQIPSRLSTFEGSEQSSGESPVLIPDGQTLSDQEQQQTGDAQAQTHGSNLNLSINEPRPATEPRPTSNSKPATANAIEMTKSSSPDASMSNPQETVGMIPITEEDHHPHGDEALLEEKEVEASDIEFGECDTYGFGWNLLTKRKMSRLLLLEELVHTASTAGLHMLLTNFDAIFAYHQENVR
ncbi:hypothetical protein BC829DRAFT_447102 [Chytridium lagenaria]|nr:hypothetical protein BC829DRAFT_447102 [Chytridium lagenaria]